MKSFGEQDYERLLVGQNPFIDVRAPIEFGDGAIPGATNLPLLTDAERHEVGIAYKKLGQEAAIALGQKLVSGSVRVERIKAWKIHFEKQPNTVIYCFRGGLRSQISQAWLAESGIDVPIISGGYKALRRFLISKTDELAAQLDFQVVSGPTGSGKTDFLKSSARPYIDLEGLAHHRGSAFGSWDERQPTQTDFENALAVELLKQRHSPMPILIEDESQRIGHRLIPPILFAKMQKSEKFVLKLSLAQRVENIFRDYVLESSLGTRSDKERFNVFKASVNAISRKLGGARAQEILDDLKFSEDEFVAGRGLDSNRVWIRKLLQWYYDPQYNHSQGRVDFTL
jgi:tRNA 2-selenouridine synthase